MKILLINDNAKRGGGASKMTYNLKTGLEKMGHEVEFFGSVDGEDFASLFSRWYSFKWYNRTVRKIKEFKPDVIHVHNFARILSPSVLSAALDMKVPVAITFHDLFCLCYRAGGTYDKNRPKKYKWRHKCFFKSCLGCEERYQDFPRNLWRLLKLILHRKILKNNKIMFTTPSEFMAEALETSLKIDVKVTKWGTNIPKEKTKYKKNIIFLGEINKEKGLWTVAEPLNRVKGYNVFALGKGNLKEELERKYKNIQFMGFQDPKQYHEEASIFVMPPVWPEGGGLSVTEAMSYGICTIASNIGGVSEQVKHMETGLLYEPGNGKDFEEKLNYLLENPSEIKRMGKNAREFAEKNCSSEVYAKRYENIYTKMIEGSKKLKTK
jgi:glycosyltransferase involved in cell wall biosynthesis